MLSLGLPALDKDSMLSDATLSSGLLSISMLPVDGDDRDDTLGSFWFTDNSLTGLIGVYSCFFDCHLTLLYSASLVIKIPINSKNSILVAAFPPILLLFH